MKKFISMLLCLAMVLSLCAVAFAAETTSATISFDDAANRTVFTTEQQVWVQNGITVTNDKAASTSNVADYAKPARFYKNSKLTVAYPGMTVIEFECNTASYATALKNSITTGTATVNGKIVGVTLDAAADSYVIEALSGGQVRIDKITVYTGGAPETPDEPVVVPATLAEQIAEANKLANKEYLPYQTTITGTITNDPLASSYTAGAYDFTVSDGTNSLRCYFVPVTGGTPAKGDTVTVTGYLTAYNGAAQYDDSATATIVKKAEQPEQPENPTTPTYATIANGTYVLAIDNKAIIALAQDKTYGYLPVSDVTVTDGVVTGYTNENLITITNVEGGFTMQDSYGRYLYMSGTYNNYNVDATAPAEGHIWQAISVEGGVNIINVLKQKTMAYDSSYGTVGAYSDKSSIVSVIAATKLEDTEPEQPDTPVVDGETEEMNIFASEGVLAGDSLSISWTGTDVKFVNEKNESSTAIRTSDTNHFRAYVGSKTTISALNGKKIAKIVITTTESKYLVTQNTMPDGVVASVDGTVVTLTFTDGAVDSVEILADAKQWRVKSIVVTFAEAGSEPEVNPDEEAAKAVDALIEAIGEVTLEKETAIAAARAAYEALSDAAKALVTKLETLTAAETELAAQKKAAADKAAADAVVAQINAIGEVTLNSKAAIDAARAAYEALTADQKALVGNLATLEVAEETLQALQQQADKEAVDKAAAAGVDALIEAIGEVTLEKETAIAAARAAYEALTADQKALVTKLDALTAAETRLQELKDAAAQAAADKAAADAATALIEKIGTVTKDSEAAIAAARAAYDALTDAQKALVENYETLTKAEEAFKGIDDTGDNTMMFVAMAILSMTAVVALASKKRAF